MSESHVLPGMNIKKLPAYIFIWLMPAALLSGCGNDSDSVLSSFPEPESWTLTQLDDGVELIQRHYDSLFDAPQFIHVVSVTPDAGDIGLGFSSGYLFDDLRKPVSRYGERLGAIAATNSGFGHGGPDYANSGILKIDGELLPFFDDEPDELHFVGSSAVGLDEDGMPVFRTRNGDDWDDEWPEVDYAMAGGHMLVTGGSVYPVVYDESYTTHIEDRHSAVRHPRTAICRTYGGHTLLIAADGRHDGEAEGLTLNELARFMLDLGCMDGINLDGGGSTTMWTAAKGVVNHPTDNQEFDHEGEREIKTVIYVK